MSKTYDPSGFTLASKTSNDFNPLMFSGNSKKPQISQFNISKLELAYCRLTLLCTKWTTNNARAKEWNGLWRSETVRGSLRMRGAGAFQA